MPHDPARCFGPYRLVGPHGPLWQNTEVVPLPPKALAMLWMLVCQAGQVVSKAALLERVWPETVVSEAVLTSGIRLLRRALGEDPQQPQYIATVHRVGYRFVAPVTPAEAAPPPEPLAAPAASVPVLTPAITPALAPLVVPLMVGRQEELARLHTGWARAMHGERQILFVTGEAGMGKTTLVEGFLAQLEPAMLRWVGRGQCIEHYGAGEAYLPLLDALGRLGRGPDGSRLVACLRQYAPTWLAQLPAFCGSDDREAGRAQLQGVTPERMLLELAEALEVLTAAQPLLLVLEDLHWSDASTVEALALLARRREAARVLVLGTYRPVELILRQHPLKAVKQELQLHGHCAEVPLGYLPVAAVQAYLVQRGSAAAATAEMAAWVHRRTEGQPLFMVHVVEELDRRGWRSAPTTAAGHDAAAVPAGLQPLIELQLGRLGADEQQVLEVASVVGAEFTEASVAAGFPLSLDVIEVICEELARRGQFIEDLGLAVWPDGTVSGRYGFRHALYQEVVYQRLGKARRVRCHRAVGARLEAGYGAQAAQIAAELAMHFERGQDYQLAVRYRQQAAAQALGRYAYREAIGHLTTGLGLLATLPETPARAKQELDLQIALGPALIAIKGYGAPEVEKAYTRARELCQQGGDTAPFFTVLWGLYAFYLVRAELWAALELGEQCLALAQRTDDAALLMEAHRALGNTLLFRGEFAPARAQLEQVSALYDPQQHRSHAFVYAGDPEIVCLSYFAWTLWFLGYPDQALQSIHKALTLAEAFSHPYSRSFALNWAVRLHQYRRESQRALEQADACVTLCTEQGFTYLSAMGTVSRGWVLTCQGQGEEGMRQIDQGLAVFQATGAVLHKVYLLALLAEAYKSGGQIRAALDTLAEALVVVDHTEERWYEAELHRLKGELLLQHDIPDELQVETCFRQALTIARRQQAKSWELRAAMSLSRLWQQQGKHTAAYELLAPVYHWFTEGFDTTDLREAKALLEELRGSGGSDFL